MPEWAIKREGANRCGLMQLCGSILAVALSVAGLVAHFGEDA